MASGGEASDQARRQVWLSRRREMTGEALLKGASAKSCWRICPSSLLPAPWLSRRPCLLFLG